MNKLRVTLEQWRTLQAVIDFGGYAQAAEKLHRSQSSLSYTIAKLQQQLGMPLLRIEGRKAVLTPAGEVLLRRSRQLVDSAAELEAAAHNLDQGWEPEIRVVVDAAFPSVYLMSALKAFIPLSRGTQIQLNEVVLSGADEALLAGDADLVICGHVPQGFLGDQLIEVEFIAVAHCDHHLHQPGRELTYEDLRREIQIVIRDSGVQLNRDVGWLGSSHRWTVTSIDKATDALVGGLGFGWVPHHHAKRYIESGELRPLPLREGQRRKVHLFMVFGQSERAGPATHKLAAILRENCNETNIKTMREE
ncbi:MAG: LysR family transcriptional regulator [Gammaproteobacteria bacterium]|nr:LysR family transcriptional regulator [Gammaproteobacteria bacterium]